MQYRDVVRLQESDGWTFVSQRGSHLKYKAIDMYLEDLRAEGKLIPEPTTRPTELAVGV